MLFNQLQNETNLTNSEKEIAENGNTTLETRAKLAAKVFRATAAYDAIIADYLTKQVGL